MTFFRIFLYTANMSQKDIGAVSRDLRQQGRRVINDLQNVIGKCEADEGLPKNEMEQERVRLKPLVEAFVEKSNGYLNMLKETEGDNDELIEDVNEHAVNVVTKWQLFLALKQNVDEAEEVINSDEAGLEVNK